MKQRKKRMTRDERKQQIKNVLAFHLRTGGPVCGTQYDIAKWIGLSPSMHLLRLLREAVHEGTLESWTDKHRPNVVKEWFSVPGAVKQFSLLHVNSEDRRGDPLGHGGE